MFCGQKLLNIVARYQFACIFVHWLIS